MLFFLIWQTTYFSKAITYDPVEPDDPSKAKPSDHKPVQINPLCSMEAPTREYREVTFQPIPDSNKREFGSWIIQEEWKDITESEDASEQATLLQQKL